MVVGNGNRAAQYNNWAKCKKSIAVWGQRGTVVKQGARWVLTPTGGRVMHCHGLTLIASESCRWG